MNHFNVISMNSVYAENSLTIKGPLAAGSDFTAPGSISVNMRQSNANCLSNITVKNFGIYAKTLAGTANILVSGEVNTLLSTHTGDYVVQLDPNCKRTYSFDKASFSFNVIYANTKAITAFLWGYAKTPSHKIKDDLTIVKRLHNFDERFWTFTVGLCGADLCQSTDQGYQSTGAMFLSTNWTGPKFPGYPIDRIIIINVRFKLIKF